MRILATSLFVLSSVAGPPGVIWAQESKVLAARSSPMELREDPVATVAPQQSGQASAEEAIQIDSLDAGKHSLAGIEPTSLDTLQFPPLQTRLRQLDGDGAADVGTPKTLEELRKRIEDQTGPLNAKAPDARRLDAVRRVLSRAAAAGGLDPALVAEARTAGHQRLMQDRARFSTTGPLAATEPTRTVSEPPGAARKTELLPLPVLPPLPDWKSSGLSPQEEATERLGKQVAEAQSLSDRQRAMLGLAAAHVGAGRLSEARQLYEDIVRTAEEKDLRQTALRNLKTLNRR